MNPEQIGEWMRSSLQEHPAAHFYERDGENWDATQQLTHHVAKSAYFAAAMCGDAWRDESGASDHARRFLKYLTKCWDVQGVARSRFGKLKYRLQGTVKSGHNDTTVGNTLTNLMIAAEACYANGLHADIIANGDDMLIVVTGDFDLASLMRVEASYGIVPQARKFQHYWQTEFCSMTFWPVDERGTLVAMPKCGRLLSRLWWTLKPPKKKLLAAFRHSIAVGTLRLMHAMPVLGVFLRLHDVVGVEEIVIYKKRFHHRVVTCHRPTMEDAFTRRYGVSVAEQRRIEGVMLQHSSLFSRPALVVDPVFDAIRRVDFASIADRFA
jgi:hypothetical protein